VNSSVDSKVDKNSVKVPKVTFTKAAAMQLSLIVDNDFTLAGKYFRLLISGKGCDGFEYSAGFTDLHNDDFSVKLLCDGDESQQEVIMDPFTAFYLQDTHVDFVQDFSDNNEGFVITNNQQKEFSGKFWKKKPEFVPQTNVSYPMDT
jgi:iron-sulfur cluster insertion protein